MLDAEPVILEELHRLAPAGAPPAWEAIVGRAGGRSRRVPVALALLAAAIGVWLAAPAFGVRPPFLDFFSSTKPAPKRVVHSFQVMNVVAPHGMNPHILAGETRRVTVYHLRDGTPFPLFVAPRKGGGFCDQFGWGGGCTSPTERPHDENGDVDAREIDLGREGSHVYSGSVFDRQIDHLEMRFADGTHTDIPLLWVSEPIGAGFFLYDLTDAQRHAAHAPTSVVAVDAQGKVLGKNRSMFAPPPPWFDPRAVSDPAHRQVILRSGVMSIAVSPSSAGGDCWWLLANGTQTGSGCAPPRYVTVPMAGGLSHGTHFTAFSAQLQPRVAQVQLRFQDGTTVELRPVDGFVLYDIPSSHWPRGRRLTVALALDAAGRRLSRQAFDPLDTGIYDCTKQISVGYGEKVCP